MNANIISNYFSTENLDHENQLKMENKELKEIQDGMKLQIKRFHEKINQLKDQLDEKQKIIYQLMITNDELQIKMNEMRNHNNFFDD